jgi:hypothetical protein
MGESKNVLRLSLYALMMKVYKVILYFSFLSMLASGCSGQVKLKSEEQKQRELLLKNKIQKVGEYYTAVQLGVKQNEIIKQVRHFNEKGLAVKETVFNSEGKEDLVITYSYDANNNLILANALNKDSSILFRETSGYDKNNNREEFYHYLPDGTFKYKNIAAYDNKNRMTELSWYWPSGFRSKNIYTYDGFKKTSDVEFSENGNLTYEWKYKYDSNDNLIEATQYYSDNVINAKINYEYNFQNQLIKQTNYQGTSISSSISFTYDSRSLLIEKTEYSASGKINGIYRYSFE